MKIKNCLLVISLAACSVSSSVFATQASSQPVLKAQLQKIIDEYLTQHGKQEKVTAIAASVLVPHDKKVELNDITTVVAGTVGYPPFNRHITANDLFDIGSITKSFTALILLQLQAEGKLSLDDPLGKWLPQYKEWKEVSLRRLLNMTSGIPNYSEDPVFDKKMMENLERVWTNEELLTYAHPEKPIQYNKNNPIEYSNSNYLLAALVIEKITNDTFANQLQVRILNSKNQLRNTFYPAGAHSVEIQKSIENRKIHGYFYDEKTDKMHDTFSNNLTWAGAAGAIVANTEDVVRWVQILYHGTLINPEYRKLSLEELESVVSMKTGLPIPTATAKDPGAFGLGIGLHYDAKSKQRFWTYQGSTLGFRVMYLWNPCNDVTTVVAMNGKAGEGNPSSKIGNKTAEVSLNLYQAIMKQYPELRCTF
jgi:D-alanyl-D-alanine carboxypeptidase